MVGSLAFLEQAKILLTGQAHGADVAFDDVLVEILTVGGEDDRPDRSGLGVDAVATFLSGEMIAKEHEDAIKHPPWDGCYARHSRR